MRVEEEADWIVAQARERGVHLSRRKLAKWHRAGLIPVPRRTYGRPGGSTSYYPAGTLEQALTCNRLLRRWSSLETAGWHLWTEGYRVQDDLWRQPFVRAQLLFRLVAGHLNESNDCAEMPTDPVAKASAIDDGVMRIVRRQLRGDRRQTLILRVLASLVGSFLHTEDMENSEQTDLFRRLLGVSKSASKESSPEAVAANLSKMTDHIEKITFWDLMRLDEAKFFQVQKELRLLLSLGLGDQADFGRGGKIVLKVFNVLQGSTPQVSAAATLVWMSVRDIAGWRQTLADLALARERERIHEANVSR